MRKAHDRKVRGLSLFWARHIVKLLGFRLAAALLRALALGLSYARWMVRKARSDASIYHCVYEQQSIFYIFKIHAALHFQVGKM